MSRMADLLGKAADALDDGRDPLTLPFLSEHGVTLDECYDMAEWLAAGARVLAWAMENPDKAQMMVSAARDEAHIRAITRLLGAPGPGKAARDEG